MRRFILTITGLLLFTVSGIAQDTTQTAQQPETFTMQEGDTTYVMQKYFLVFLKTGPERSQSKEEAQELQKEHLAYLEKMANMGKTSITGPLESDGEIRGIVVYNTATIEEARQLAEQDPAVKAGRLVVEVHPWWAAKGSTLK